MFSAIKQLINPINPAQQLQSITNKQPSTKKIAKVKTTNTPQKTTTKKEETPTPQLRVAKLIMVTKNNNNKFYEMKENGDGNFTVLYGRVGSRGTTQIYPMNQWDKKIREKTRKGYTDQTHLFATVKEETSLLDLDDKAVQKLLDELMRFAKQSIAHNYIVSAEQVTKKQVEEAQAILNKLIRQVKRKMDVFQFNDQLLTLFKIIPRKMTNVNDHLVAKPQGNKDLAKIRKQLAEEQATLDVMRGQVELNENKEKTPKEKINILDALGLSIEEEKDAKVIRLIKKMMADKSKTFHKAYRVVNHKTQASFDNYLNTATNKTTQLFWHGSRNENWMSIMKGGLVLRPANAIINGKMFGYGLYFADKFQKSLNYTSLQGSYWARGSQNKGFLALYDVHVGEQLVIKKHQSWCCSLNKEALKKRGDKYDSIFAKGGYDLINNEYIVYESAQCTIKYLIEVR